MSETSCHFKTKLMKIDIAVILEYPTYLSVILLSPSQGGYMFPWSLNFFLFDPLFPF
jgi:hypothetical protein